MAIGLSVVTLLAQNSTVRCPFHHFHDSCQLRYKAFRGLKTFIRHLFRLTEGRSSFPDCQTKQPCHFSILFLKGGRFLLWWLFFDESRSKAIELQQDVPTEELLEFLSTSSTTLESFIVDSSHILSPHYEAVFRCQTR